MLDAALDRGGRTQIPLREEMGYVDAYLYISRERLGDGFHVYKEIDQTVLDQPVPRLILQPIVENAVEHDITARRGGSLWVRACRPGERMVLEVEHDGTMNEEDRERIRTLLSGDAGELACGVGLRNVHQRLKLIYGDEAALEVGETERGTILARIEFPAG
jgi:LytS/YehU family sensor histidine kinase